MSQPSASDVISLEEAIALVKNRLLGDEKHCYIVSDEWDVIEQVVSALEYRLALEVGARNAAETPGVWVDNT